MKRSRSVTTVAALALFALFAVAMLAVLLGGARVYRGLTARDAASGAQRTAAQYVTTGVRQAEAPGAVSVAPFGGREALCITRHIDGTAYTTYIYCHDGYLRELFARQNSGLTPADGEKVLPLHDFAPSLQDGLLTAVLTMPDGTAQTLYLHIGEVTP